MASKVKDLLKANRSTAKPGKSKIPTIQVSAEHDALHNAYLAMKDAVAAFETLEKLLVTKADAIYAENAQRGNFFKSYNFPGVKTPGVQVIYKDQFSAVKEIHEEKLKELIGEDFDRYFEENVKLQLKDTSEETIELLTSKLGKAKFLELFDIKLTTVVKPDMDRKQFELSDDIRAFVTQWKPSVKLAK